MKNCIYATTAIVCWIVGVTSLPTCIVKDKKKSHDLKVGCFLGLEFFVLKISYKSSGIFLELLNAHVVPRKVLNKVLPMLVGRFTHCNSNEMLKYANQNDISLLPTLSHNVQCLQLFSIHNKFYESCTLLWTPGLRKMSLQFASMLHQNWEKLTSVENIISGSRASVVVPFNLVSITEYHLLKCNNISASHFFIFMNIYYSERKKSPE